MIVTISARHMEVTPTLRSYAEQKVGKLEKHYNRIQGVEVVFDASNDKVKVETIVNVEHIGIFVASHGEGDAYACVDGCVHKLERQLTDHKELHRNRKHPDTENRSAVQV